MSKECLWSTPPPHQAHRNPYLSLPFFTSNPSPARYIVPPLACPHELNPPTHIVGFILLPLPPSFFFPPIAHFSPTVNFPNMIVAGHALFTLTRDTAKPPHRGKPKLPLLFFFFFLSLQIRPVNTPSVECPQVPTLAVFGIPVVGPPNTTPPPVAPHVQSRGPSSRTP